MFTAIFYDYLSENVLRLFLGFAWHKRLTQNNNPKNSYIVNQTWWMMAYLLVQNEAPDKTTFV